MANYFSVEEQKAVLKILDFLIRVDDFIHIQEVEYLDEIIEFYQLDSSFLLNVEEYDLTESFQLIEKMPEEKRDLFIQIALGQAQADNVIVRQEKDFLSYIKQKIKTKNA